jgi:hypothetical protein
VSDFRGRLDSGLKKLSVFEQTGSAESDSSNGEDCLRDGRDSDFEVDEFRFLVSGRGRRRGRGLMTTMTGTTSTSLSRQGFLSGEPSGELELSRSDGSGS